MLQQTPTDKLHTLVRRFQRLADGEELYDVVAAVSLLSDLPGGAKLLTLWDKIHDAAIEVDFPGDNLYELLTTDTTVESAEDEFG